MTMKRVLLGVTLLVGLLAFSAADASPASASCESDWYTRTTNNPHDVFGQPVNWTGHVVTEAPTVTQCLNTGVVGTVTSCTGYYVALATNNPWNPMPVYTPPAAVDANGTFGWVFYEATAPLAFGGCVLAGGPPA